MAPPAGPLALALTSILQSASPYPPWLRRDRLYRIGEPKRLDVVGQG